MGWLSVLGKIGAGIAAPFTGGLSLAAIPAIDAIGAGQATGQNLGAIAKGRAQGRMSEAEINQQQDRLRQAAAAFNRQNPQVRAGNAVHGDVLSNVQDFHLGGSGRNLTSEGGLRPSLLSSGTRQLGSEMSRQALLSQMGQGGPQDPYANFQPTPLPQANAFDKVAQVAGYGSALAPAVAPLIESLLKKKGGIIPTDVYNPPDEGSYG